MSKRKVRPNEHGGAHALRFCSLCVFLLMVLMLLQCCCSVSSLFIFLHCDNITHTAHTTTNKQTQAHKRNKAPALRHNVLSLLSLDTPTKALKKSPPPRQFLLRFILQAPSCLQRPQPTRQQQQDKTQSRNLFDFVLASLPTFPDHHNHLHHCLHYHCCHRV